MKYLAIVLMPAKKGRQFFKLTTLFDHSVATLRQLKNTDDFAAYQCAEYINLEGALEMVQALHPAELYENAAEDLKRYMTTKVTHAILEVGDDFDADKPLQEAVMRIFLLQPEGYPHLELGAQLDSVEDEIKTLKKAGADQEKADDELKEKLEKASALHKQLQAELELALTKPLEFKGPQYAKLQQQVVEAQAPEVQAIRRESGNYRQHGFLFAALQGDALNDNNAEPAANYKNRL